MSQLIATLATALLLMIVAAGAASAQTFGSLSGTVTDSSNAVVTGAMVTVTNTATGTKRTAKTSSSGYYSFPDLLAGNYSIRVEAVGFQSEITPAVKLDAAAPVSISYKLHVGDVKEAVQVEAVAPELDRTTSSIGDTFSQQQVESLPINGHDYGRFAMLTPGAILRSAYIADITFDGLSTEAGGYFYLDGVDATRVDFPFWTNGYERGARLMSGSQETVAEFRVQANGYQAEYGRSGGGVVTIISRSGTDHWHGEAYEFNRNESYDARNFFARTGPKPLFRFNDYGGNIGGPIFGKNTFLFVNYEGNVQNIGVIDSGTVLSSTSRASALAAHPELAPLINDFPIGVDSTTNTQLATVSLNGINNVTENTASVRLDHNFSPKDSVFARYNYNESLVSGPLYAVTLTYGGVNARQGVPTGVTNIAIHEQHIFNPRLINDALVGFQRFANSLNQLEPIPTTIVTGLSLYAGGNTTSTNHPDVYQYGDAMTMVLRNHTLKWGGTVWRTQDNYSKLASNTISYSSVTNFINNVALQVVESAAIPGSHGRATEFGFYAQDNWQATPKLAINYGIRWDVATPVHDAAYVTRPYNTITGTLAPAGQEYYPANLRDFGPRVGFAYSPNPTTVIRAGAGVFYRDQPLFYPSSTIPVNTTATNITLTQAANPGLKYPFTSFNNGTSAIANVYGFLPSNPDLYSIEYNLGVQQELMRGLSFQMAYVGLHAVGIDRPTYDINLYKQGTTVRPNTNFGDIYLIEQNGFTSYNGLQTVLKAHFGGLIADLNYAYSHAIDNVCDAGIFGTAPQDYTNIRAERASGCQDERQNFKFNTLYKIPIGTGYGFLGSPVAPVRALVSGWSIDSLGIMHSGIPQNVTQSINTYGNGDTVNQRPNLVAGQPLYVPKTINSNGYITYWNPNAWTYPATGSYGNSPRNVVFGPHFTQVDASLIKTTPIHKEQVLEFRVQMYNIFNHPNFGEPSAVFAPGSLTFGNITSTLGSTLGFGSARQLELALKYKF